MNRNHIVAAGLIASTTFMLVGGAPLPGIAHEGHDHAQRMATRSSSNLHASRCGAESKFGSRFKMTEPGRMNSPSLPLRRIASTPMK